MKKFNNNATNTLILVLISRLIAEYQTLQLATDEDADQSVQDSPQEEAQEANATEESVQEEEGLTRGGAVDPARTRVVDPARTRVVDPARTR
jgi:hypothetical protein